MTLVARIGFLVLVGATFAAFFVAQRLKSSPPVLQVHGLARYFSPNGDGVRDVDDFSIVLKSSDEATVDVITTGGDRVRRLASNVHVVAYRPLRLSWDGRTDAGKVAPDGLYRLRVSLRDEGRSAVYQKTMELDTTPPKPIVCLGGPCRDPRRAANIAAPGAPVRIYVKGVSRYSWTRIALLRTDDGPPKVVYRKSRKPGYSRIAIAAPTTPGVYLVRVSVRDRAGNVGTTPAKLVVGDVPGRPGLTVRGLAAQPPLRPITAGRNVTLFVDARGAQYRWDVRRIGERRARKGGLGHGPTLTFHAPNGASGAYVVELSAGRYRTSVPLLVQATQRSSVLVVVPAISWLGSNAVDDPPFDGLPNTLTDGGSVVWPRVFAQNGGLPPQFSDDVAKLLIFFDHRHIRYDLTTDLDLDLTREPRVQDRKGVLLAGPFTWVTRPLAQRLRRYVAAGGRVASIGAASLRRGVSLRVAPSEDAGTLSHPTELTAADPFGARLGKLRRTAQPQSISQTDGQPSYGLMTGAVSLPGFSEFEESAPVAAGKGTLLAGVGEPLTAAEQAASEASGTPPRELEPALTAVKLGKGTIVRVGLPQWYARLGEPGVAQVTQNIVDILRGVQPRIRSTR